MTTELPPKRTTPLTAADAFTRICDLHDGRNVRRALALEQFQAAESEAIDAIAARVPEEQRARLRIMLAAMPEAERVAAEIVAGRDVPAMTADEMRAALDGMPEPRFTVQPKTRVGDPLYVSADEIDDAPEEHSGKLSDVAGMDEVPARLREPLSASRLAIGKGR